MTKGLLMPKYYETIEANEQTDITGGGAPAGHIPNSRCYLSKDYCYKTADLMLAENFVTGMSRDDLAKELYAHAVVFYTVTSLPTDYQLAMVSLIKKTCTIDIEHGGDSRQWAFNIVWALMP